ncbi:hypothetical protein EUU22_04285, partial [Ciceribacter ferrooxidans]
NGRGALHYDADGHRLGQIGQDAGTFRPRGIGVDPAGRVYIADTGHARVLLLSSDGNILQTIGGDGAPILNQPTDVAISVDGSV